jgi:hypothetical protein
MPPPTTRASHLCSLFVRAAARRDPDQPVEAALEATVHPALLHLFAFVCSGVGLHGLGATMPEAGNYTYKKTDSICDGVCGEVSHSAPLPRPHSLARPCQICPTRRRGAFLSAPRCLVAVDALRISAVKSNSQFLFSLTEYLVNGHNFYA